MGGCALILYGKIDLQAQKPPKKSFFNFFRKESKQQVSAIGKNRILTNLPIANLKPLAKHFLAFIHREISTPNDSSKSVLDYLSLGVIDIYVRHEEGEGAIIPDPYVQMSFSGCAGMAEVSAELAMHWATLWFKKHQAEIMDQFLTPYGFKSIQILFEESPIFVPVNSFGYGVYRTDDFDDDEFFEEEIRSKNFSFDESQLEAFEEESQQLTVLDQWVESGKIDLKCHCQLCDPSFQEIKLS